MNRRKHKPDRRQRLDLPANKWSWLGKSIQLEAQGHNDTKDKADVFVLRKLTTNTTAKSLGSTAVHPTEDAGAHHGNTGLTTRVLLPHLSTLLTRT